MASDLQPPTNQFDRLRLPGALRYQPRKPFARQLANGRTDRVPPLDRHRSSAGQAPYGYVNRAIPDDEFENFVDRFARRVSRFDREALADIKRFVNNVSLPPDEEFPPQLDALGRALARPAL